MKLIFTISVCFAALTISCKKSGSVSNPYFIKASIDGIAKTFNVNAMAIKQTVSGITAVGITGYVNSSSSASSEGISMSVNNLMSGKPIIAGSYSQFPTDFLASLAYLPGNSTNYFWDELDPNTLNPLQITITSIDNTTVKGNFSGDVYNIDPVTGNAGTKKTITNGAFEVKF